MRQDAEAGKVVSEENDIPGWIESAMAMRLAVAIALGMLFVYLHLEFNRTFGYLYQPVKLPLMTLLWLAMGALFLYELLVRESRARLVLLLVLVGGLFIKLFAFDLPGWHISEQMIYGGAYSFGDALLRLA